MLLLMREITSRYIFCCSLGARVASVEIITPITLHLSCYSLCLCFFQTPKSEELPDIEGWDQMEDHEAAKWAVGSALAPDISSKDDVYNPTGTPKGTPAGTGWPGQSARFLHVTAPHNHARFVHDSVVARLSPEDIKKARELKQSTAQPVRQKVRKDIYLVQIHIYTFCKGETN